MYKLICDQIIPRAGGRASQLLHTRERGFDLNRYIEKQIRFKPELWYPKPGMISDYRPLLVKPFVFKEYPSIFRFEPHKSGASVRSVFLMKKSRVKYDQKLMEKRRKKSAILSSILGGEKFSDFSEGRAQRTPNSSETLNQPSLGKYILFSITFMVFLDSCDKVGNWLNIFVELEFSMMFPHEIPSLKTNIENLKNSNRQFFCKGSA